jgi:hypothetical protein
MMYFSSPEMMVVVLKKADDTWRHVEGLNFKARPILRVNMANILLDRI